MFPVGSPYPMFFDAAGKPLADGSLYFGTVNLNPETNPITVYWDLAGTQPAAQPVKTHNGYPVRNGTPAVIYSSVDFSMTARDKKGILVYTSPSVLAGMNYTAFNMPTLVDLKNYASLAAAIAAIGATPTTLLITSPVALTGNTTIPSTLSLMFLKGGVITTTGYALIINSGTPSAGRFQIFAGTGGVTFNGPCGKFFPEWWGVIATATIATAVTCTTQMKKCIVDVSATNYDNTVLNGGGTIELPAGVIKTGAIDMRDLYRVSFKGQGMSSTIWISDGAVNPMLYMGKSTNVATGLYASIEDIRFIGGGAANLLLGIDYVAKFAINRCYFQADGATVTLLGTTGALSYTVSECFFQGAAACTVGVDILGVNATGDTANNITFTDNEITNNGGGLGLRFRGGNIFRLRGGAIENCGAGGIRIEDTNSDGLGLAALIDSVWFENITGIAVELNSGANFNNAVVMRDLMIVGSGGGAMTYGIYINGGAHGVALSTENVTVQNGSVKDLYATGSVGGLLRGFSCPTYDTANAPGLLFETGPSSDVGGHLSRGHTSQPFGALTVGSANPSVYYGEAFETANVGAVTVLTLTNYASGQMVFILGKDGGNTTFKHAAGALGDMYLAGGVDVTLANGKSLILINENGHWYEIGGIH